jgi:hypothetical protein
MVSFFINYKGVAQSRLTKKAEPPPTRSVDRDSGTDNAIGGWLRRLVRPRLHRNKNLSASGTQTTPVTTAINQMNVCCFADDQLGTGTSLKQMKRIATITANEKTAAIICMDKSGGDTTPHTTAVTPAAINARFITGLIKSKCAKWPNEKS